MVSVYQSCALFLTIGSLKIARDKDVERLTNLDRLEASRNLYLNLRYVVIVKVEMMAL